MLQDIEKGRQCEIDFINGKFVALGKQYGVPTPYMESAVRVITMLQNKELSLSKAWDNLNAFPRPVWSWKTFFDFILFFLKHFQGGKVKNPIN